MIETEIDKRMVAELKQLIAELENGLQHKNPDLALVLRSLTVADMRDEERAKARNLFG